MGDPRVPDGSTYNRENVIRVMTDLYTFLSQMPYVKPEDVLHPPPDGWPITREDVSYKTDEVYQLLRHLPYVRQDRDHWSHPRYMLQPYTVFCDYRQDLSEAHLKALLTAGLLDLPPHVLPLTQPSEGQYGSYAMLDTTDGTVTELGPGQIYDDEAHKYADDDSRAWRNKAQHKWDPLELTQPIEVYFGKIVDKFTKLEYIPRPGMEWPGIYHIVGGDETDEQYLEAKELQKIYRRYGWPDLRNFQRDDCYRDLEHWLEEKDAAKQSRLMNAPPILPGAAVSM
ncbi:hypothetical protein AMS68_007541 [Peltaster fructicola]|uniref:Uncharacterized protein n=1 Tax=Peltaster fructicola TaxID=286661 RepID=A0A6H0Y4T3_9PEZI|nr:hypothetical protein AMS68_007541 [Peltaster fructicola]